LVVGLNSDASVHRLKGSGRPINREYHRALVLAGLAAVDAVVIFDEDTPLELIKTIPPDVLVKGANYRPGEVVGGSFVESYGGVVFLIPVVEGHSTTSLINRVNVSLQK
ncbi:bifunctional heptose 7-phosphate kinase/heptose 1-phosphate adenyltransferase, partial [Candidatus Poribacteria bacterium]|nr:bifunctional heptose 7-phosphate kinase/heptose 1-phosphate adenyltransferase [Candidatus Poribacteria bacterium]